MPGTKNLKTRKSMFTQLLCWPLSCPVLGHLRLIDRYHQRCLHTILNIQWSGFSIEVMRLEKQLHWAGHVSTMEDNRLPKIVTKENHGKDTIIIRLFEKGTPCKIDQSVFPVNDNREINVGCCIVLSVLQMQNVRIFLLLIDDVAWNSEVIL